MGVPCLKDEYVRGIVTNKAKPTVTDAFRLQLQILVEISYELLFFVIAAQQMRVHCLKVQYAVS